jgi:LacI family transcriptional regulator, galactose operon repressor
MPPTIHDVARLAGVGTGTVSRVINGHARVSEATRARVLAAVEQLGYRPSPAARAFGRRRTHILEILVPTFSAPFFLETLQGVETALQGSPYTLLTRTIASAEQRERTFEECCRGGTSDGVLTVWISPTDRFLTRLAAEGVPAVLMNASDPRAWSVGVDHARAAQQAVTYCLERGHRRIALVDRVEDPFDPGGRGICERGYRQTMAAAGLETDSYTRLADFSAAGGAQAATALLELPEPPTAIVTGSDIQAIGIVESARARGWPVPSRLSVVGYNDSQLAQFIGLTTVKVPVREIGLLATQTLLGALERPDAQPTARMLPTEVVVRQTCGSPPAA